MGMHGNAWECIPKIAAQRSFRTADRFKLEFLRRDFLGLIVRISNINIVYYMANKIALMAVY